MSLAAKMRHEHVSIVYVCISEVGGKKDVLVFEYKVSEVCAFRTDLVKGLQKYIDSKLCFHYGNCVFCRSFRFWRLISTQISIFISLIIY